MTIEPLVVAVPGPIAGAGLPALIGMFGAWFYRRRRSERPRPSTSLPKLAARTPGEAATAPQRCCFSGTAAVPARQPKENAT